MRPDWIVDLGGGDGQAEFFASLCDLVGSGRVLSVREDAAGQPEHPRITHLTGTPIDRGDAAEGLRDGRAKKRTRSSSSGRRRRLRSCRAFKAYAPLVGVGSYAIVEGTVVNGHPVLPGYGPGPAEALTMILKNRRDFAPDHRPERFGLTFNPRGFLRRVE